MGINFPNNPNIYFILIGFMLVSYGFTSLSTKGDNLACALILLGGAGFVLIGLNGLMNRERLENKKLATEIELLDAKVSSIILGR